MHVQPKIGQDGGLFTNRICSNPGGPEVDDGAWLNSFMHYDLSYGDLRKTLQTSTSPVGAKV